MSAPPVLASSSPAAQAQPPPPWRSRCHHLVLSRPARAFGPSCGLPRGTGTRYGTHPHQQPRLVATESPHSTPLAAVRRDAETGLALLLVVHAVVMSFFLSLTILSLSACRALQKIETVTNKLAKVFAEEMPGTLSSLKLCFLEINDLTSQLKNLGKRLTISRWF